MSDYYLIGGVSEAGGNIVLSVPWTHKVSELRCLCVVDEKEHQEFKVLNSKSISGSAGVYTIVYPFSVPGLSWKAYLWRETTRNRTVSYDGGSIPVEAMISKITELSDKSDEAKVLLDRIMMFPEDTDGKMFLPPVNVRKGEVLGFDDEGKPTVGENCAQVKALFEAQDNCEAFVKQAQVHSEAAREQAGYAQAHATDAMEAAREASEHADNAEDLATECLAWYQKTSSTGAVAMNNAKLYAAEAKESAAAAEESVGRAETAAEAIEKSNEDLNKALCYVACSVKRIEAADESAGNAATSAAENAAAALESRVAASASAAEAYKYAQQLSGIYKYCGTVATEADLPVEGNINGDVWNVADTGKNFAWDGERWDALGAEVEYALADGGTLNGATIDSQSGVKVSVEMSDVAFADNANMYAYVGTFANCGCAGLRITPKTIAFYRRTTNLSVDTNVPRYLRVLRKNAQNEWYIAYQSTNGLAPNSFRLAGALMTWTMAEVEGGAIPTDERIAIVQCDAEDAGLDRRVLWGAKTTGAYGGGVGEDNIDNPTILAFAPAIRMSYDAVLPLATTADVEEERRERAESDSALGAAVEAEVARATAAEQANAAAIALKANDADVVRQNNCRVSFHAHEDSGGMALYYEGINPEQTITLPYYGGEARTIATTDDIPTLQELFTSHDGTNIDVGSARVFITAPVADGYFSGFQLSDFSSRIYARSPSGKLNGFTAMASEGYTKNRVFGAALQLAVEAELDDEAVTLGQVNSLISGFSNDADVVHLAGDETITGVKTWANNIDINGKTVIEADVGEGVLKFRPKSSTAQTVLKRDGANVVIQTQNAGVAQTTWTMPGGKTGTVALTSDITSSLSNYETASDAEAKYVKLGTPDVEGECTYLTVEDDLGSRLAACQRGSDFLVGVFLHDAGVSAGVSFNQSTGVVVYNMLDTIAFPRKSGTVALTSDIPDVSGLVSRIAELEAKVAENTSALNGLKIATMTQSDYDALTTKDAATLYVITEE